MVFKKQEPFGLSKSPKPMISVSVLYFGFRFKTVRTEVSLDSGFVEPSRYARCAAPSPHRCIARHLPVALLSVALPAALTPCSAAAQVARARSLLGGGEGRTRLLLRSSADAPSAAASLAARLPRCPLLRCDNAPCSMLGCSRRCRPRARSYHAPLLVLDRVWRGCAVCGWGWLSD